jgi:hypothetical protein
MEKITIKDLTEFFKKARIGDKKIHFKNTEMINAVREASLEGNFIGVLEFSKELEESYARTNPNEPKTIMLQNARETLVALAYWADYSDISPLEWMEIGPAKAYTLRLRKDAMNLVQRVYESRQIDIVRDIFPESIKETHSLN